ncbi:alpha/beta fold hydrolase [Albidovulum sp.]|uniref:alpha/beta fold hydrolase n=1 Tax=Albidovulum sp. TaxID=1872424 RepID=UPI0039B921C9
MSPSRHIRFCTSADGTRIAVSCEGSGPVLLRAAHWLTHVVYDHESPVWRPWIRGLSRDRCYVRYDQRGCGLSDRFEREISFKVWMEDPEAVAATLPDRPFALLGMSQGGALAISYALRHPERVSHLILYGAYGQGATVRARTEEERLEAETLVNLVRVGWARDNPAFRQVFTNTFIPGGTAEQHDWWNELERRTASPDTVVRTLVEVQRIDGSMPPAVCACRRWSAFAGRPAGALRGGMPAGRADSGRALRGPGKPQPCPSRRRAGLAGVPGRASPLPRPGGCGAPRGPRRRADAGRSGSAAPCRHRHRQPDDRAQLGKGGKTVRNQITAILGKLGVHSRAEAIVRALTD